jgi:hypothetical protein
MSKTTNTTAKKSTNTKSASAPAKVATAPVAEATPVTVVTEAVTNAAAEMIGTPAQLVARGVRLNGNPMSVPDFSHLRKFHFKTAIDAEGYVRKQPGVKGKPAEIVRLIPTQGFAYSFTA